MRGSSTSERRVAQGKPWQPGDFVAHAAHDLRNPLCQVLMAAEALGRQSSLDEQGRQLLRSITASAERGLGLIDGLVELARSRVARRRETVSLARLVDEAAQDIENLDVDVEAPAELVVDGAAVRRALHNLLANAARYACVDGRAQVSVGCVQSENGWRIWVADRGPGLDPEDVNRVFHAFERGTGTRDIGGSGLGLAIVYSAAAAHGGRAWYKPRPGGGASFWFSIHRDHAVPEGRFTTRPAAGVRAAPACKR